MNKMFRLCSILTISMVVMLFCSSDAISLAKRSRKGSRTTDNTRSVPQSGRLPQPSLKELRVPEVQFPTERIPELVVPQVRVPADTSTSANAVDPGTARDRSFSEIRARDITVPEISINDPGGRKLSSTTVRRPAVTTRPARSAVSRRPPAYSPPQISRPALSQPKFSQQPQALKKKKAQSNTQSLGTVSKVVDAGTIEVTLTNGRTERVRYEGFDSALLNDVRLVEMNQQLADGKIVLLDRGRNERDAEGNVLAKVYIGSSDSPELILLNTELQERLAEKASERAQDTASG